MACGPRRGEDACTGRGGGSGGGGAMAARPLARRAVAERRVGNHRGRRRRFLLVGGDLHVHHRVPELGVDFVRHPGRLRVWICGVPLPVWPAPAHLPAASAGWLPTADLRRFTDYPPSRAHLRRHARPASSMFRLKCRVSGRTRVAHVRRLICLTRKPN